MKKVITALCATVMAFATAGAISTPALATPPAVLIAAPGLDVVDVQFRPRNIIEFLAPVRPRYDNRYEYRHDRVYYNGYRGYRDYRTGYQRYNGYWFPRRAFVVRRVNPLHSQRGRTAHQRWCFAHYRSYRASSDTFQPNHGPRKRCRSPY